jgi:hypothetical protein
MPSAGTVREAPAGRRAFSQELRAAGDIVEDVLNLTLGWYYYDAHYTLNGSTQMDACVFLPGCPSGAPGVASFTTVGKAHQNMYSNGYFGQLIWAVTPNVNDVRRRPLDVDINSCHARSLTVGGAGPRRTTRFPEVHAKVGMDFRSPRPLLLRAVLDRLPRGGFNRRARRIVPESVGRTDPRRALDRERRQE